MRRRNSGREPISARSPLRLRLVLSIFTVVVLTGIAIYAFARDSSAGWWVNAAVIVLDVFALIDLGVVIVRLRQRDTPPSGRRKPSDLR